MSLNQFYYKKNRIQQLKGFYNVVREGGISSAARKMGLTQAAVTLQIQSLERDVGVKLFDRVGHKITLTKEGKTLYLQSIYHIQGLDDMFESFIQYSQGKKKNNIDIATNHAVISYILPKYIKEFKNDDSSIKFKLRNLSKEDCFKKLLSNEVDIVIYPTTPDEIPDELEFYSMVKYQPILLSHKGHPLSIKKEITLNDVSKYNLLRIDPNLITLPGFEELLKSHGIKSSIDFEMSDWEILKKFVKADLGVAMISNIVLEGEEEKELVQTKITNYFPEMNYGFFIKKGKKLEGILKSFTHLLENYKPLEAQE